MFIADTPAWSQVPLFLGTLQFHLWRSLSSVCRKPELFLVRRLVYSSILLLYKLFQSRWDLKISLFSKASYMFVGVRLRGGLWSSQPFPSLRPVMTGQPMGSLKGAGPSARGWWTARYCLTGEVRQVRHLDRGVVIVLLWNWVLSHRLFKFFFTILSDIRYYCVEIIFTTSYYQHENCSYSYSANA